MLSHSDAKAILEHVAPELTLGERVAAQAVALHESSYGAGWREGHGAGSHNWGAIMRPTGDDGPFFETRDSRPGTTDAAPIGFVGHFKVYPDDAAGALDVVHVALKPNVRGAVEKKDLRAVAQAMHDNVYYTGTSTSSLVNVMRYENALRAAVDKIISETGEDNPFPKASAPQPAPHGSGPSQSPGQSLPVLRPGDSGDAVSLLRAALELLDRGNMLAPSPHYDDSLSRAVSGFQGMNGLTVDRVVGPKTWAALAARLRDRAVLG